MSTATRSRIKYAVFIITFVLSVFLGFHTGGVAEAASGAATQGKWSKVSSWPVKAVHTSLLPDGKVVTWPSEALGDSPHVWNPKNDTIKRVEQAGYNLFCAGLSLMGDGKLFVAGGHIVTPKGLKAASIFDPATKNWTRVADMNAGRWYPTVTQLGDGNMLVTSGNMETGVVNRVPQIFNIKTGTWRSLAGAGEDTAMKMPLYPWMYELGNGKVFMAGSAYASRFLYTSGSGSWGAPISSNYGARGSGTSVMYDEGKVLILGGSKGSSVPATNTAEIIDLNSPSPQWTYTASMREPRRHANAVLLPTGNVLVVGGTRGVGGQFDDETSPVFLAEMWNPKNGAWTALASSNGIYRGYHSTALLLPDGRVLLAGGEKSPNSAELYSPPYLFQKGERPKITSAPKQVNYGEKFNIETTKMDKIKDIRWIRMGSVTHSFNQGQRINELKFEQVKVAEKTKKKDKKKSKITKLKVTVPKERGMTPPGYYMLFVLDDKGVPSEAAIIKVGGVKVNLSQMSALQKSALSPLPPYSPAADAEIDHAAHANFE